MNENINLCEILKGHENKAFYNPLLGILILYKIDVAIVYFKYGNSLIEIPYHGKDLDDNIAIFPSKDQRDWNKWDEEHNPKVPKTWSELYNRNAFVDNELYTINCLEENVNTPIEKSALALLKIRQLIEVGYGGNITDEEWETLAPYHIWYDTSNKCFMVNRSTLAKLHIAFHTKEQAEKFLKYPENIQLLKDYFMI